VRQRGEAPFVLALDVGTSSTRALLFDARGRRVPGAGARAPHRLVTTPDGGAFLDAEELCSVVSGCLAAVDRPSATLLAMDSFWHSLMGLDGRGRPTTPVLTWADTRASDAARELREGLDERHIHTRTGSVLHAAYWPAKLLWLSRREPDAFRRTKRWMSFAEWFQSKVTGELACSISMASGTGLLNQRTCDWDPQVLAALPLEPDQLSPLVDLDRRLGAGAAQGGGEWLPAVGDGASSNAGSGCASPARLAVNIGTSSAMRALLRLEAVAPPAGLWCYRLDANRIVLGGALSEGGNLWRWLRSTLRLPGLRVSEATLAEMAPDAHGLTILPFIAGERSTGWSAAARLTLTGMSLSTTSIDLLRAAMEAVAYRLQAIYQRLETIVPGCEIVAGGSAILSSPTWLQILADVLDRPVHALADSEATARGTALLALESAGLPREPPIKFTRTYEPDPGRHARYLEAIGRQAALYQRLLG
jgi:gluconokinase